MPCENTTHDSQDLQEKFAQSGLEMRRLFMSGKQNLKAAGRGMERRTSGSPPH